MKCTLANFEDGNADSVLYNVTMGQPHVLLHFSVKDGLTSNKIGLQNRRMCFEAVTS